MTGLIWGFAQMLLSWYKSFFANNPDILEIYIAAIQAKLAAMGF